MREIQKLTTELHDLDVSMFVDTTRAALRNEGRISAARKILTADLAGDGFMASQDPSIVKFSGRSISRGTTARLAEKAREALQHYCYKMERYPRAPELERFFESALMNMNQEGIPKRLRDDLAGVDPRMHAERLAERAYQLSDSFVLAQVVKREGDYAIKKDQVKQGFQVIKAEFKQQLQRLHRKLKLPVSLGELTERLESVHLQVFDPLYDPTPHPISYEILPHTIVVSAFIDQEMLRPALLHEMVHTITGIGAQVVSEASAEDVDASHIGLYRIDRFGVSSLTEQATALDWLNEGLTELLARKLSSGGFLKGVRENEVKIVRRLARAAKHELFNLFLSDGSMSSSHIQEAREILGKKLDRSFGQDTLEAIDRAYQSQAATGLETMMKTRVTSLRERFLGFFRRR